ncbi:hypothetical protein V1264_015849 [Littorina saxatilis]|uniref:Uncharacterized protein n=1 Tax=Littorina saxatilis TaxID=31220 RepID=A0AAN9GGY1_9CAEN
MLGAAWQIVWLVGPFILAGLSYVLRDWRHLQLAGSLPPVIFLVYWWIVPESPRWLVSKGRVDEAMVTLSKVARVNGNSLPTSLADKLKGGNTQNQQDGAISPLVIFKYPVFFVRFLVISFNWSVLACGGDNGGKLGCIVVDAM